MRRFSVAVSETAQVILRHLHPGTKKSVRKALDDLSKDPSAGKPLKEELSGLWSLPVSHYRVIYQIEANKINILFIGPRRDVYERLRELITEK